MSELSTLLKPVFQIFVIGAAGSPPQSNGQLPDVKNILSFMEQHEDRQCYFFFIDPRHLDVSGDLMFMHAYQQANIPFSFVPRVFNFDTFLQEYKIDSSGDALFIDFANVTTSEYVFMSRLGDRKNWHYYTPGCNGVQLDLSDAYERAIQIPRYTIYKNEPIPMQLSTFYREDIIKELTSLVNYVRYIPEVSTDPRPPEWFLDQIGRDESMWTVMRQSAYQSLAHWFQCNNMTSYDCYPTDQWYKLVRDIVYHKM